MRCFLIYFLWWDAPTCIGQKSKGVALNKFFILLPVVETPFIKKGQQLLDFSAQQCADKNIMLYSPNNRH